MIDDTFLFVVAFIFVWFLFSFFTYSQLITENDIKQIRNEMRIESQD